MTRQPRILTTTSTTTWNPQGAVSDASLDRDEPSVGYRCRRDALPPGHDESRSCHHFGAHHPTTGLVHDGRHPMVRGRLHPTDRRVEHGVGSHSCRHADWARSEPAGRAPVAARHSSTSPRCRRRRHPMHPTNPTQQEPSAHRRFAAEAVNPNQWVTRERVAAIHRSPARSSAATVRCRSRN